MNFSSSSHSSKSRSRSNSNLKRKPSFSLPFTSVVGGSNCSSNSDSAPSPVFGAYSVPSSPNRIPSFKLDDSSNIKLPTIPKLSKNESLKIRTKRSYPNLSSKRSEPSLSHSRSPSTSIPISSPFHRELEIDPKSASPSNLSYSHDQLVKNVRVGSYNQQQSERVEVWDRQDPSPSRYVGQRDDAPLQPGLQSVGNQEQYAVIGKEKEKGHRRSSTSHHSSSKVREVSRTEPKLRKVSSNSNLSISSTSSAPIIQSKSSSPGNSKTSSPLRENEDGQKSNQLKNLKASGSSSTSLPILETNSNRHHSSERFKKIRSGRKDAPPELRIDFSTSDRGADGRPMSSASSSSSFSNQSFSSTNDSTYSYPSSSNSHVQDPRFLKNPQMGKGKGKLGESCQTPTQNSWSKNGRKNSSSTTVDSIHSLSGSPGKYLTSSPSKQPSLIRYNVCPSISLKSSSNEKVNEYRNDDFGLEVRGKVGEKENQDDTSSTDQSKRNGSSSSSSSSSSANTSGSHLVMSMEGDVMFASKVKKGFFKSLSGKAGDVELRKGGVDGPIVMQANSNHSKSFTRISTPSFNISRHPSPALVGEYRGLMLDSRSRYANASKPIKSPRLDLVGDFGHPSSPNESDQKLDMSGWSGNLKQVDVWGQRWNFSLPKYEDVPLAKAILEIQEEKKSLLNSNSNHSSRSNSPANRSHSPNSYRSNSNNSNSSTSMPNLNHITAASISNRRKVSPIETHITSYALGQRDGERLFEWVGAGSAKWELIERDVEKLKGREKVVATFMREVTVKEGQGVLTFDQDFPDEEILILSLITLLDWHMKTKVY